MNIFENLKMAIESIKSNKMRSFLTMLGIIIGISSVIMIVSAGDGGKQYIMSQFEQVGSTTALINVDDKNAFETDYITKEDVEAIETKVPNVKYASPMIQAFGNLNYKGKENNAVFASGNNNIGNISGLELVNGRFFSKEEYSTAQKVVVVDETATNKFFGTTNVLGMSIDATISGKKTKLKIIGVAKSQTGDFVVEGMPAVVYIPISTYTEITGKRDSYASLYVTADVKENTENVGNLSVSTLEARHSNRSRKAYKVENMMMQVDMINSVISIFQAFIAAVAAISLVVGGVGVMNIMLVAVTERTREIGIRKSLGAKTSNILFQFLTESAILTFIGGLIGLGLGFLGSFVVCSLIGIEAVFSVEVSLMTLLFSSAVGIFFGIYPARKAARMSPIDALRHE